MQTDLFNFSLKGKKERNKKDGKQTETKTSKGPDYIYHIYLIKITQPLAFIPALLATHKIINYHNFNSLEFLHQNFKFSLFVQSLKLLKFQQMMMM